MAGTAGSLFTRKEPSDKSKVRLGKADIEHRAMVYGAEHIGGTIQAAHRQLIILGENAERTTVVPMAMVSVVFFDLVRSTGSLRPEPTNADRLGSKVALDGLPAVILVGLKFFDRCSESRDKDEATNPAGEFIIV